MGKFIDLMLKKANHEEQAYKSCLGILLKSEKKPGAKPSVKTKI
jgi:hypothetical protein